MAKIHHFNLISEWNWANFRSKMDGDAKSMAHKKQSKGVLSSSKAEFIPKFSIRTESKPDESRSRREFIEKSSNGTETKSANFWNINQTKRKTIRL